MRRKKITMVDPWQITSRGWKAFKTPKSVETFTNRYHVNHVYWRAPGNKRVLLVDFDHFRECYQEYRKTSTKPTSSTTKRRTTAKRTIAKRPTSRRTTTRKSTVRSRTRRRTVSNRPKTRYSTRRRTSR